jgi:hypothetical protein
MIKPAIPYEVRDAHTVKHVFKDATLIYPALLEADTRFEPQFKTGIRFDSEEDPALVALLETVDSLRTAFMEDAFAGGYVKKPKKGDVPVKDIKVREVDEEDDTNEAVFITASCKAVDFKGNDITIPVVDAARNPLPRNTAVGGGSVANVVVLLQPWHMAAHGFGVSVKLVAAQVTQVRTGRQQVNVESEFEVVEGGFTAALAADEDGDF